MASPTRMAGTALPSGMRALFPALILVLPSAAQDPAGFQGRLRALEAQVDLHFRGQPLDAAREEVKVASAVLTERIRAFNARMDGDRAARTRADAALKAAKAAIDALDQRLKDLPMGNDEPANKDYQALLAERNAQVKAYNAQIDRTRAEAEAAEKGAMPERNAIEADRAALERRQAQVNARIEGLNAFQREGRDLVLFLGLNQLLADLRRTERSLGAVPPELAQVRRLRRELAAWAAAQERNDPNGLAVAEIQVEDEPCWFFVDTGAQRVTLPNELVAALGLEDRLRPEAPLVLAGGHRIQGRELELPALTVGGRTVPGVAATVIPSSRVGVDGLLGQSFLRRVGWSLDASRAEPLLVR